MKTSKFLLVVHVKKHTPVVFCSRVGCCALHHALFDLVLFDLSTFAGIILGLAVGVGGDEAVGPLVVVGLVCGACELRCQELLAVVETG